MKIDESRYLFISVIIPVRDGEGLIGNCLGSLTNLDYPKDKYEIIVADGLSTDSTAKIARSFGAKVIINKKQTVVSGRNVGFKVARGKLIAFSDVDCIMDKNWLKNCVKYFKNKKVACVGGPNLVPDTESAFSKAVGLIFDYAFYIGKTAPTKILKKPIESRSHGSNAIYQREALAQVMPIDETLVEGEDVEMNNRIKSLGYKLLYVPDVIVYHFRRATPRGWWNQMVRYGQAKILLSKRKLRLINPVQILVGLSIPIMISIIIILYFLNPLLLISATFIGLIGVLSTFGFALLKEKSVKVALNLPLAVMILAVAWSYGFLWELVIFSRKKRKYK